MRDIVLDLKARSVAVLLNSHLIGEVERVCDRVVILDRGRVAASGTLAELLGQRKLRLQLTDLSAAAEARLAATGTVERDGDWFTVALPADDDATAVPDLVRDLVAPRRPRPRRRARPASAWRSGCSASCAPAHGERQVTHAPGPSSPSRR